jgi:hypothetical protein
MDQVWTILVGLIWAVLTAFWWLSTNLLWLLFWYALPLILIAFIAIRAAEYVLGKERVRTWVRTKSLKFGRGAWQRTHRVFFALGTLPLRVLWWLFVFGLWHSLVALFWTPRWSPWQRAWSRRWTRRRPS